jgi:hypothetical protein
MPDPARRIFSLLTTCALAVALIAGMSSLAHADALVVVEVRSPEGEPKEGQVTLAPVGDGETHGCETREGRCRIEGVPGGRYRVTLDPKEGEPPPPKTVMIPPSGRVSLIVSTEGD